MEALDSSSVSPAPGLSINTMGQVINNMNDIRIYTSFCLTCEEGDRVNKVKRFAKSHDLNFQMRQTYVFPELKKEASELSDLSMPFVYHNGKSMSFYDISINPIQTDPILDELIQ
jgi:hypothetical protein